MTVSLRVVGIFFRDDAIPHTPGMTVEGVLDAASSRATAGQNTAMPNANLFNFTTGTLSPAFGGGKTISAFVARYSAQGPTSVTSDTTYRSGEFFLSENLAQTPSYTVWQYYVFTAPLSQGGAYIPNSPRILSYENAAVPDGGMVVWRLVSVLAGRNEVPGFLRRALGVDPDMTAEMT
ncbi:MAG: hypothetical protein AAFV86_04855 [Pseudomonadota bacterium]